MSDPLDHSLTHAMARVVSDNDEILAELQIITISLYVVISITSCITSDCRTNNIHVLVYNDFIIV